MCVGLMGRFGIQELAKGFTVTIQVPGTYWVKEIEMNVNEMPAIQPDAPMADMLNPQTAPAPKAPPKLSYNGTVLFNGQPIEVRNNKAVVDGETFICNNTGELVFNTKRQFVGSIITGEFVPATPELVQQLKAQGKL